MEIWIAQAAAILRVHVIRRAQDGRSGELTSRGTRTASLNRVQVRALLDLRVKARGQAEFARSQRRAGRQVRPSRRSPDEEHDRLTATQAAALLGVSRVAVQKGADAIRCRTLTGTVRHRYAVTILNWSSVPESTSTAHDRDTC